MERKTDVLNNPPPELLKLICVLRRCGITTPKEVAAVLDGIVRYEMSRHTSR